MTTRDTACEARRSSLIGKVVLLICLQFISSCGHGAQVPNWFLNPPRDPFYLYAAGTAKAPEAPLAYLMATLAAREHLADMLGVEVQSNMATIGSNGEPSQTTETSGLVVTHILTHSQVESVKVGIDGQVYVLLSLPIKSRADALSALSISERGATGVGVGTEIFLKGGRIVDANSRRPLSLSRSFVFLL
jgi:hypothetical protein